MNSEHMTSGFLFHQSGAINLWARIPPGKQSATNEILLYYTTAPERDETHLQLFSNRIPEAKEKKRKKKLKSKLLVFYTFDLEKKCYKT